MSELDNIIKTLNKKEDIPVISKGIPKREWQNIKFSSPLINYMTYGGIPKGTVIEFAGEENGGKTTTALDLVANAQKQFKKEYKEEKKKCEDCILKRVVFCDCENTLKEEWAKTLGVDTDELILLKPMAQSAEEIFDMLLKMMETGEVGLVVIDSLGVMVSQQAYDKDVQDKTYGGIAAALTVFGKKAQMICARTGCILLGINQIREDMAGFNRVITTGGKGWKHLCTFRFIFKKGDYIDEKNNSIKRSSTSPAGNLVEIAIVKDKAVKPDRLNGYYTLKYDTGVDILNDTIELACWYDIIRRRGSYFDIIDIETGEVLYEMVGIKHTEEEKKLLENGVDKIPLKFQGKPALLDYLKNNEDLFNKIYKQVMNKLEE